MQWYDWMIIIAIVIAIALAGFALYRSYNLTAEDFRDA
jgi:prolipoprotein diacylglyceryltransferase